MGCRWRGSSVPQVPAFKILSGLKEQLGSLILEAVRLGDHDDRARRMSNAGFVGDADQRELAHAPISSFLIGDSASTWLPYRNARAPWLDVVSIEELWIAGVVELGKLYGANTEGMSRATPWGLRPTRQTFARSSVMTNSPRTS